VDECCAVTRMDSQKGLANFTVQLPDVDTAVQMHLQSARAGRRTADNNAVPDENGSISHALLVTDVIDDCQKT